MSGFKSSLPYRLPQNEQESKRYLAQVIGLPSHYLVGDDKVVISALAATILYRHLGRVERMDAMRLILSLSHGPLKAQLVERCADTAVMPQWGEWSLSNEELESTLRAHNAFNRWSSILGGNPGAYGVGGSVWSIAKEGVTKGNVLVLVASLALIGLHEFSYQETQRYSAELDRRKHLFGMTP